MQSGVLGVIEPISGDIMSILFYLSHYSEQKWVIFALQEP